MLVKTEEISDRPSGSSHSMIGLYKHRRTSVLPYKGSAKTLTDDSGCYISDAPALCDWSFPLGCLKEAK